MPGLWDIIQQGLGISGQQQLDPTTTMMLQSVQDPAQRAQLQQQFLAQQQQQQRNALSRGLLGMSAGIGNARTYGALGPALAQGTTAGIAGYDAARQAQAAEQQARMQQMQGIQTFQAGVQVQQKGAMELEGMRKLSQLTGGLLDPESVKRYFAGLDNSTAASVFDRAAAATVDPTTKERYTQAAALYRANDRDAANKLIESAFPKVLDPIEKALKESQIRANDALAAYRNKGGGKKTLDDITAETEARARAIDKVHGERDIATDIHHNYFDSKLNPLTGKTISEATKSGAVIINRADVPIITNMRMVSDSLNLAERLVPKLLSEKTGVGAVLANRIKYNTKFYGGDPDAREFEAIKTTHIIPFIRSMTNRLNQREIDLAYNSIPNNMDSRESATRKIEVLRGFVRRAMKTLSANVDTEAVVSEPLPSGSESSSIDPDAAAAAFGAPSGP